VVQADTTTRRQSGQVCSEVWTGLLRSFVRLLKISKELKFRNRNRNKGKKLLNQINTAQLVGKYFSGRGKNYQVS